LGRIDVVPHKVIRTDPTPVVSPSCRYLYTPQNEAIIHAKTDPLIQLGVYIPALPQCKDRTQLTIVKTAKVAKDRNKPEYCRVAHDFKLVNAHIAKDPEPVDCITKILSWIGEGAISSFFKTDTNSGFFQIVCANDKDSESLFSTCFEMFHGL